jgi:hypothetical protein
MAEVNTPSAPIFITSLVLAVLAVAGKLLPVPFVTERAFGECLSAKWMWRTSLKLDNIITTSFGP